MNDETNREFWDQVANIYTKVHENKNKDLYATLCNKISPYFTEDKKVLELACGTGQLTSVLSDKVKKWEATDFSLRMVELTNIRVSNSKLHCAVADATNLMYPDQSYDIVLLANALHIMPDPEAALAEIKRVLKPDGILIAPTFVYDGKIDIVRIWIMERIGFKTYHKWKAKELIDFVEKHGFVVKKKGLIKGTMLPECIVVCEPNSGREDKNE